MAKEPPFDPSRTLFVFFQSPNVTRVNENTLTHDQVQKILESTGAKTIVLTDTFYTTWDRKTYEEALVLNYIQYKKWQAEYFDCDNFTEVMLGEMRIILPNNAFGMVHVDVTNAKPQYKHALNFFVDHQGNWWYYEPQTGEIFRNPFYKPYFFYV